MDADRKRLLCNRLRQVLLYLLTLCWCQYLAEVEVIFHFVVTGLLLDITEGRKLFFYGGFIPFP
ncbi:hypothetical protein D3C71_1279930 [compost metagenome]